MKSLLISLMAALIGAGMAGAAENHVFWYNCVTNGYNLTANPGPNIASDAVKHEGMVMSSMCRTREGNVDAGFNIGNYDCGMGGPGFCAAFWSKDLMSMSGTVTSAAVRGEYRDNYGGGCQYCIEGNVRMKVGVVDYAGNIDGVWGSADDVPATASWMDPNNLLGWAMTYNSDTTKLMCEDTMTFVAPAGSQSSYDSPLDKQFATLNCTRQVNWILSHTGANKGKYSGQYAIVFLVNQKVNGGGGKINLYADESGNAGQETNDPWTSDANTVHLLIQAANPGDVFSLNDPNAVEKNEAKAVSKLELHQNTPNPFTSSTEISYNTGNHGNGVLKIYNANGALVYRSPVSGAGSVSWNAKDIANGIYQYRLTVGNETITRKMILMK